MFKFEEYVFTANSFRLLQQDVDDDDLSYNVSRIASGKVLRSELTEFVVESYQISTAEG